MPRFTTGRVHPEKPQSACSLNPKTLNSSQDLALHLGLNEPLHHVTKLVNNFVTPLTQGLMCLFLMSNRCLCGKPCSIRANNATSTVVESARRSMMDAGSLNRRSFPLRTIGHFTGMHPYCVHEWVCSFRTGPGENSADGQSLEISLIWSMISNAAQGLHGIVEPSTLIGKGSSRSASILRLFSMR